MLLPATYSHERRTHIGKLYLTRACRLSLFCVIRYSAISALEV